MRKLWGKDYKKYCWRLPLRGKSKDHKEAEDKTVGPDFRPIMGAIVGPNIGLSELGSMIVRKIADNADGGLVAKSTEEVLNKFETFNKRRLDSSPVLRKLIIASMDIEKYYPNILSKPSAKIIRRMWEDSELSIDGIDLDKLIFYLGIHLTEEDIIQEGFTDLLYTKEKKMKMPRKLTKKLGRKNTKKITKKNSNMVKRNVNVDNLDILDNNMGGGDDTPNTHVKKKT